MVNNSTKFIGICFAIYLVYALIVFIVLPFLVVNPLSMSRYMLAEKSLGDLSNYTLETGGKPKRSMLVTFRGSGAFGLLDYLSHQAGCYHHFAPLISYRNRITNTAKIKHAMQELISLYSCNYNYSMAMINFGMKAPTFREFYGLQSKLCSSFPNDSCWSPDTLSAICKIFPFINMSVYNLGLDILKVFLEFKELDLRMLFLVRDPRGIMASRANPNWCKTPECFKPNDLCQNLESDYAIAMELVKMYPTRFAIVRYEELVENPLHGLEQIFQFYDLPIKHLGSKANEYTDKNLTNEQSLFFDNPMDWLGILSMQEISYIQTTCTTAMQLWGYNPILDFDNKQSNDFVQFRKLPLFLK